MVGQRFGRLTVTGITRDRHGKLVCECACDCGRMCTARACTLTSGKRTQCAKWNHDVLGQRFGRLTILDYAGPGANGSGSMYRCQCDCGNVIVTRIAALRRGHTKSCGCYSRERARGNRFVPAAGSSLSQDCQLAAISSLKRKTASAYGVPGVYRTPGGRYQANIWLDGRKHYLGVFATEQEAVEARLEAERDLFDPIRRRHGLPDADAVRSQRLGLQSRDPQGGGQ